MKRGGGADVPILVVSMVAVQFKLLPLHLPEGTEGNHNQDIVSLSAKI
jgi:hypothetical protein